MTIPGLRVPFTDGSGFGLSEAEIGNTLRGLVQVNGSLPDTRTRSSLALALQVVGPDGRHRIIGAGNEWSVSQAQPVEDEWEINQYGDGTPGDMVYGNVTTRSIRFMRLDLYSIIFEEVFGTKEFEMLSKFRVPVTFREVWLAPTTLFKSTDRIYGYIGCRCTSLDRAMTVGDDRIVKASATFSFKRKVRLA